MSGEQNAERPSNAAHTRNLKKLPCMVTAQTIGIELHHAHGGSIREELKITKAAGAKTSEWLRIPLCHALHTGAMDIETMGVHAWEQLVAKQTDLLRQVSHLLGYDVIAFALEDEREE